MEEQGRENDSVLRASKSTVKRKEAYRRATGKGEARKKLSRGLSNTLDKLRKKDKKGTRISGCSHCLAQAHFSSISSLESKSKSKKIMAHMLLLKTITPALNLNLKMALTDTFT